MVNFVSPNGLIDDIPRTSSTVGDLHEDINNRNSRLNQGVNKLSGFSRTGSRAGDVLSEESDWAEGVLGQNTERGGQYRQQARRQRLVAQRMRMLSEEEVKKISGPRNAKFKKGDAEQKTKLDRSDIGLLIGVALLFDLIGGVISLVDLVAPPIGELINGVTTFPLATFTLYLMYKKRGIEFKDGKVLVRFWGSLLIGFIPLIAILPEYTLNVILMVVATKAEEKVKI